MAADACETFHSESWVESLLPQRLNKPTNRKINTTFSFPSWAPDWGHAKVSRGGNKKQNPWSKLGNSATALKPVSSEEHFPLQTSVMVTFTWCRVMSGEHRSSNQFMQPSCWWSKDWGLNHWESFCGVIVKLTYVFLLALVRINSSKIIIITIYEFMYTDIIKGWRVCLVNTGFFFFLLFFFAIISPGENCLKRVFCYCTMSWAGLNSLQNGPEESVGRHVDLVSDWGHTHTQATVHECTQTAAAKGSPGGWK